MLIDIEELKTITLKQNQTLIVKIGKIQSSTDRMALKLAFEGVFPNNKIIIIDKSMDLSAIEDCTDASRRNI